MGWVDWLLIVIFVPPLAALAGAYWGSVFHEHRPGLVGLVKRWRRKRRPKVFWPD